LEIQVVVTPRRELRVTASLIVRNEEAFLPGCLASLDKLIDDVVVVDTGSTDATRAIAQSFGARVVEFAWTGNFAAARNRGLEEISSGWILYIDADERAGSPGNRPIATFLDPATDVGGFVRFQPRPGFTHYLEPRLFRCDPAIRFAGRIHETYVPDMAAFAKRNQLRVAQTPVTIEHFGYEGDQKHKVARNLPLLEAEVSINPARPYLWHHLAEMLAADGRKQEAIETCRIGLAAAKAATEKDAVDYREIVKTMARLLIEQKESASELIACHLGDAPRDWSLLYLKGRSDLLDGNADSALAAGLRLSAVRADSLPDELVAYDRRLFGELAWDLIAMAHLRRGRHKEAARAFRRAFASAPHKNAYYMKAAALDPEIADSEQLHG
jgi:hypothetical protein